MKPEECKVVGWRVKDFADGWIYFEDAVKALNYAIREGAAFEPVFGTDDEPVSR